MTDSAAQNSCHLHRIDRVHRGAASLGLLCVASSVALIGLGRWLALLPLAFWTGWVQLSSP
jgi:hypothetical protein